MDLNPAQQEVVDLLRKGAERVELPTELAEELRADLTAGLQSVSRLVPEGETLWVSKHLLASVHGCEAHAVAEQAARELAATGTYESVRAELDYGRLNSLVG